MLEKLKGYKTVIVFGLVLLNGVAVQLGWGGLELPPDLQQWSDVILAAVALLLRAATSSSIFKRS